MLRKAEGGCRFILRDRYRLNSASEGFRHVASAKESESYGGAGFTGNMDACLWKTEVEEKSWTRRGVFLDSSTYAVERGRRKGIFLYRITLMTSPARKERKIPVAPMPSVVHAAFAKRGAYFIIKSISKISSFRMAPPFLFGGNLMENIQIKTGSLRFPLIRSCHSVNHIIDRKCIKRSARKTDMTATCHVTTNHHCMCLIVHRGTSFPHFCSI